MSRMLFLKMLAMAGMLSILAAAPVLSPPQEKQAAPAAAPAEPSSDGYMRVTSKPNESLELDVASRRFEQHEGHGPSISLVGVAHVGNKGFYAQLQELLNSHELVLFESVKPPGAGRPGGSTDQERIDSTSQAIRFLTAVAKAHHKEHGAYPTGAAELTAFAATLDERMKQFVAEAMIDAWGRPVRYVAAEQSLSIESLGCDGAVGGEGPAADITSAALAIIKPIEPMESGDDHGLQSDFARTLGLAFQLDAIDYDRAGWVCSDMAIDEVDRAMREHGADFSLVEGQLAGTTLSGRLIKMLLGLMRVLNWMSEGASNDLIKVMLIELLGDEKFAQEAIRQYGQGFEEVIVNQRNQVVIDDLKRVLQAEKKPRSIAVFYGAAHMPDLERRLADQLGYVRAGEAQWFPVMGVDLVKSKLTAADIRQLRMTLRQTLRQSLQPPPVGAR